MWGTECWPGSGAQLTQSCSDRKEQRLPTRKAGVQPSPVRAEQSTLLAGHWQLPASMASAGAGRVGTSLHPTPVPWQAQLPPTSQPALMLQVGEFSLFCIEPKASSPCSSELLSSCSRCLTGLYHPTVPEWLA